MKTSNILIRVTEEEKDHAQTVADLLGKKNISTLIRDFINDMYSCFDDSTLGIDIDLLIESYKNELELLTLQKVSPGQRMNVRYKINVLEEIKKERGL